MARVYLRGFYGVVAGLILASVAAAQPISQLPNKGTVSGDAAGLETADEFVIYCPGCPVHPIYSRNRAVSAGDIGDFVTTGGGGTIICRELDGSPSVDPADTLIFDQTDGFTVTDLGSDDARIDWAPAFNYVASVADGTGIDGTATGVASTYTPTFDATELNDLTWGNNSDARVRWEIDSAGALNPVLEFVFGTPYAVIFDNETALGFGEADGSGTNALYMIAPTTLTGDQTCLLEDDTSFIPDTCVGDGVDATGASVILDLGDDAANESSAITEFATVGDTASIFTEPSADKLLVTVSNPWPTATALAANGGNCDVGYYARGGDASGAAENCTADDDIPDAGELTITYQVMLKPATCQNATPYLSWDHEATNFPAATCVTGTNTQKAFAAFDQTTDECIQTSIPLPSTWTGAVDAVYKWNTSATSGSVAWCTQIICVADAETGDPAYPAQASGNCVTDTAKGTTLQYNDVTDTSLTITGCAAGEEMYLRTCRDPNETGGQTDTAAADANLIDMYLLLRGTAP